MNNFIQATRRRNILISIIIAFFIIGMVAIIYVAWYKNTHTATLNLLYTPASAAATANGVVVSAGNTQLVPGTYTVVIKKSGFNTYTDKIILAKNSSQTVTAALVSNSPSTSNWYTTHPSDQRIKERIGAISSEYASNEIHNYFQIATVLPLNGRDYSVNYGTSPDHSGQYALYISYTGGPKGQQDAVNTINNMGYNAYNYEIVWTDNDTTPATTTITQAGYTPHSN